MLPARLALRSALASGVLVLLGASGAHGQDGLHVLRIEAGALRMDGRALRADRLPAVLATLPEATGFESRYEFRGPSGSTLEINGIRYRLADGRLHLDTELTRPADAVFTLGPGGRGRAEAVRFGARSLLLRDEAAPYAAEQEWALEAAAFGLATRIRGLEPGADRDALTDRLRRHLLQTFDLKQTLRERELEALEADIRALRRQVEARERQRDRLVEQRMRELVGPAPAK